MIGYMNGKDRFPDPRALGEGVVKCSQTNENILYLRESRRPFLLAQPDSSKY